VLAPRGAGEDGTRGQHFGALRAEDLLHARGAVAAGEAGAEDEAEDDGDCAGCEWRFGRERARMEAGDRYKDGGRTDDEAYPRARAKV
jgi:hypothetical protein